MQNKYLSNYCPACTRYKDCFKKIKDSKLSSIPECIKFIDETIFDEGDKIEAQKQKRNYPGILDT